MNRRRFVLFTAASLAVAAVVTSACQTSYTGVDAANGDADAASESAPPASIDAADTDVPIGSATGTGLPCDVEAVLQNDCIVCHAVSADAGAPPLVTYADLKALSTADPTKTRAALAVEYMTDGTMPIPPAEPADPDEIATMEAWINAGYPEDDQSCEATPFDAGTTQPDAGGRDASRTDGGCSTGRFWTQGDLGSELMHPGEACIACHTAEEGPKFRFAGTVFDAPHDSDDCDGDKQYTVIITDKNGTSITAVTNAAGNFSANPEDAGLQAPFSVRVGLVGMTFDDFDYMQATITGGDCNGCHTSATTGPGRIVGP